MVEGMNSDTDADGERVARERAFHDERFAEQGSRETQKKFYAALKNCVDDYNALLREKAVNSVVLEYGCATGDISIALAPTTAEVHGIDISGVAIEHAKRDAASAGLTNSHFYAMNAEAMEFEDDTFDLVFGSGIIHHLDTEKSYREIRRVLKPKGVAVFKEPLGHNLALNAYRVVTPSARTPDEHPLLRVDFELAESIFASVRYKMYGLSTIASVPFRRTRFASMSYGITERLDQLLFKLPGLKWQAWYALMELEK